MTARFEAVRKALHIAMGGFAFALRYLTWGEAALLALVALLHNWLLLPRYAGVGVYRGAEERGADVGVLLYPASVLTLILLFPHRLELAAAGWAFLAFGDGLAAVVGVSLGRRGGPLPWNRGKTWAGFAAFLVGGIPLALVLLRWVQRAPLSDAVVVSVVVVGFVLAILESLPTRLSDNLTVPLAAGGLLYAASLVSPEQLEAGAGALLRRLPIALAANVVLAAAAFAARSVNWSGVIHGVGLGVVVWVFGGASAFAILALFFVIGSVATRIGGRTKEREGTAQENRGRRGARHAWANAGVAALFAVLAFSSPHTGVFQLGLVAALATALCDTLGSEIGQAYGRRTILITTLRPAPRGADGAISLEGTLAGIAGASTLAGVALGLGLVNWIGAAAVILGAFAGSMLESLLGALLEQGRWIGNEMQNFLNTLVGALVAIALYRVLG